MDAFKLMRKSMRRWPTSGLLIWLFTSLLLSCAGKEPIRVGFVAQLTGVQAELGVQERNGVQLAVEEINAAGGIAGRPIELIIEDDLGTPEGAQAADRKLIEANVIAIIGHATSGQTMAGLAVTNSAQVVMISPTATTPELSGLNDFFFRTGASLANRAQLIAQYIYEKRYITRVAVIYDTDNAAYSQTYLDAFSEKYQSLGGQVLAQVHFSSQAQPDFVPLVTQLYTINPGGLILIAADIDTALIAQQTRLMNWTVPLFTTAWAQTETLIHNGGQAVEGLEVEIAAPLNGNSPDYLDFETRYQNRFGGLPAFGAASGYETAKVLAAALQETGGKAEGLPQALVNIKDFKGLNDTFSFDKYGDVMRPFFLGAIRNGKYVQLNP